MRENSEILLFDYNFFTDVQYRSLTYFCNSWSFIISDSYEPTVEKLFGHIFQDKSSSKGCLPAYNLFILQSSAFSFHSWSANKHVIIGAWDRKAAYLVLIIRLISVPVVFKQSRRESLACVYKGLPKYNQITIAYLLEAHTTETGGFHSSRMIWYKYNNCYTSFTATKQYFGGISELVAIYICFWPSEIITQTINQHLHIRIH